MDTHPAWRKSTFSAYGADCVEVAAIERIRIAFALMRTSMPDGPKTERDHGAVSVMETVEDCLALDTPETDQ